MAATQTHPSMDYSSAPTDLAGLPTYGHTFVETTEEKNLHDDDMEKSGATDALAPVISGPGIADDQTPSAEDMATLRKISATVPWTGILLCVVELAERASYYGSTDPFNNFLANPLPIDGNGAGAVASGEEGLNESAGALNQGSVITSALLNLFAFLAYVVPIWGAILSDTKWGRFKTICVGTFVGFFAHILLIIPALPSVIAHPQGSVGAFSVAIFILSWASGFIKPALSPLFNDQSPVKVPTLKTLKSGERVIVDPGLTVERYTMIFYCIINVGAFFALATDYASRFVGFWLAFLLPGLVYMLCPIALVILYKRIYHAPPQGSVVVDAYYVFKELFSNGGWKSVFKGGDDWWNRAKPTHIEEKTGAPVDLAKIDWDDKFVDEIRQTVNACGVFLLTPIFIMGDGGIGNSLISMSVAMTLNGAPNDLVDNFNPLAIIIATPILSYGLYPFMTKIGYPLKPMTKICIGCLLGCAGCVFGALVQWRIYLTSPCGYEASDCLDVSPVSLWWQIPIVMLPAVGELFVIVTTYELAYTRAPARMKALVYAFALFSAALAAALQLALSDIVQDPYLVWAWVAPAGACFVTAWIFPIFFRHLNEPVINFADKDRMEGKQQPGYLVAADTEQIRSV